MSDYMMRAMMKVAFDKSTERDEQRELTDRLKSLDHETLGKIATGEIKMAYGGMALSGGSCGDETQSFLGAFEGTPLLASAIALEQQEIELEMQQAQKDQARAAERKLDVMDDFYEKRRLLGTQKKMLSLELAKSKLQSGEAGPPPPPGLMGAPLTPGAPPPGAPPGPEAPPEAAPEAPKMASASIERMKLAFNAAGLGQAALNVAKANKGALLGAGIGAAGGAAAGGLGEHGSVGGALGGALGGAALGAGAGAAGQVGLSAQALTRKNPAMGIAPALQQAATRQAGLTTRVAKQGLNGTGAMSAAGDARIGAEHVRRFAKGQDAAAEAALQARQGADVLPLIGAGAPMAKAASLFHQAVQTAGARG